MQGDASARLARWLAGQFDFAPGLGMVVRRLDLDVVRKRKPNLQTAEFLWMVNAYGAMKLDQEPFKDARVRRALALATNWKEMLAASPIALGHGVPNPAVPAALTEWAIPIDQLSPSGRRLRARSRGREAAAGRGGIPVGSEVPAGDRQFWLGLDGRSADVP